MINNEDIFAGKVLKKLRLEESLSLRDLAAKLKLCYESVNKYEKGKSSLNLKRISNLCYVFNVEPNVFFKNSKKNNE